MAVITPNTDLYLLKVPLEINDINQLKFNSATAQFNYFNSLPKIEVEDFTYQRKDSTIRFPEQYDDILTYNYVMYRNDAYSNKWFYAYITDMQYVNDNMTLITIKSDVFQCWQFDLTYKPCLVEREHTNDDTVGKNTLPEDLELGEFVVNGDTQNFGASSASQDDMVVVVDVSMVQNNGQGQTLSYGFDVPIADYPLCPPVNGMPSGVIHLLLGYNEYNGRVTGYQDPSKVIEVYNNAGLTDAVINCYLVPTSLINTTYIYGGMYVTSTYTPPSGNPVTKTANKLAIFAPTWTPVNIGTNTFSRPTTLDGYTPKNNKLKCYPFCYFNISNNAGSSYDYRYEDFSGSIQFKLEGAFCPSGSIKAVPLNYKNIGTSENAYDYSVNGGKYPILSWASDSYTNWLTQNSINMSMARKATVRGAVSDTISAGLAGGGIPLSLASGGASLVGGTLSNAREEMRAKTLANFTPDQVHGDTNAGDLTWSKLRCDFTYLPMSIKAEYARCADNFLSMFGYATNRVKIPNITGRRNWNYVKTISCYIEADIPQEDLQEIKGMFDRGITLWHNTATFADYSQNNDII